MTKTLARLNIGEKVIVAEAGMEEKKKNKNKNKNKNKKIKNK
jgi:hypothetical protein